MKAKKEHSKLLNRVLNEMFESDFDSLNIKVNRFGRVSYNNIDISTTILGIKLDKPIFINTVKGDSDKIRLINSQLNLIAKETGLTLISSIKNLVDYNESLKIDNQVISERSLMNKKFNSTNYIVNLANDYKAKLLFSEKDLLDFKALQVELDFLKEVAVPERITKVSSRFISLKNLIRSLKYPILVKETGDSIKRETLRRLKSIGVKTIDISGYSGNNLDRTISFSINNKQYSFLEDYGQSAVLSLLESKDYIDSMEILVSSGIRNSSDILKCLALGAKAVGITQPILDNIRNHGLKTTIIILNKWIEEIKMHMYLLSVKNLEELRNTNIIIKGRAKQYALYRGIDYEYYKTRNR